MPSLSDAAIRSHYCQDCKRLFDSPNIADASLHESLITAVNRALATSGVPKVTHSLDTGSSANGVFDFSSWAIQFGGGMGNAAKTRSRLLGYANTVYHEARHCEQWYRILQALAKGHLTLGIGDVASGKFQGFDRTSVRSMADTLFVPQKIAKRAIDHPDYAPVQLQHIKSWWTSIYSRDGGRRGNILHKIGERYDSYRNLREEVDAWYHGDAAERDLRALVGENQCAWPNLHDWRELTGRSWHFRSGRFLGGNDTLVALDNAIEAYERGHTPDGRSAIKAAFDAWSRANPQELAHRNAKKDADGRGGVDKLREFLASGSAPRGGIRVMV